MTEGSSERHELVTINGRGDRKGLLTFESDRIRLETDDQIRTLAYVDMTEVKINHRNYTPNSSLLWSGTICMSTLGFIGGIISLLSGSLIGGVITVLLFGLSYECHRRRKQQPTTYYDHVLIETRGRRPFGFCVRQGMGKHVLDELVTAQSEVLEQYEIEAREIDNPVEASTDT